jgi:hypothetical protein
MKTSLRRSLAAASLLVLALLGACESDSGRHPRETKVCVLMPDVPTPDVELGLVSAIQVVLPGPDAGSDLLWEIISNNNTVLEQMGPIKAIPGASTSSVSFYALKPGKSVLRFYLVHPGQQEAIPVSKCEVTVRVKD